jgi:integrase
MQLAITTGMRQGELFGLEWRRIEFSASRLRVEQAVAEVNGVLHIRKPKTKRGLRTINLTPDTLAALDAHRTLILKRGRAASALVFPAIEGGPQSRINFGHRFWRPLLTRTELDYRGAHNLRHTYATIALGAGVPVHVVSQIMGHSKPSITHDIYAHVLQADQQHATTAMTRIFG